MQKVKPITHLTTILSKLQFESKEIEKNKTVLVLKKGYPRLFFEILKSGIAIKSLKELNDAAITNEGSVFKFINDLNQNTLAAKYYLQTDNKVCAEVRVSRIENEVEYQKLMKLLKFDMQQLLKNHKSTKKYLEF